MLLFENMNFCVAYFLGWRRYTTFPCVRVENVLSSYIFLPCNLSHDFEVSSSERSLTICPPTACQIYQCGDTLFRCFKPYDLLFCMPNDNRNNHIYNANRNSDNIDTLEIVFYYPFDKSYNMRLIFPTDLRPTNVCSSHLTQHRSS